MRGAAPTRVRPTGISARARQQSLAAAQPQSPPPLLRVGAPRERVADAAHRLRLNGVQHRALPGPDDRRHCPRARITRRARASERAQPTRARSPSARRPSGPVQIRDDVGRAGELNHVFYLFVLRYCVWGERGGGAEPHVAASARDTAPTPCQAPAPRGLSQSARPRRRP